MSLQAIIMAGGEGVRLRPLTVHRPKPLVPLLGEPVMGYAIQLLKKHGVGDIGVTLWYQPQKIRRFFGRGEQRGVQLRYYEEREPLGTAGSVKMAKKQLKDTFFVLSGDGLTDCDLTDALRFHREKKALATLVLKRVNVPLPYGVVLTDGESRITRFIEKPSWSRVFSDLVNTGIYILEPEIFDYIPDEGMPDFGKDIFPALLAGGLPLYGYETEGYWCDVGNQKAYLEAQMDLLSGKVKLEHSSGVHETAQISPSARIEGSCLIGANAVIGPGAVIKNAVIGDQCRVESGAVVENACLWPEAQAKEKARVSGSVLCEGAIVRRGAEISDGCALGERCSVGSYALLRPGACVWPHLKVAPGAVVSQNVTENDYAAAQWTSQGADCDSAERVCALCGAFAKVTGARRVLVAHGGSQAMESLAAGAFSAAGVRVLSGGAISEPMLRMLISPLGAEGGVYAAGQTLRFYQAKGEMISSKQMNAMSACVLRQEGLPSFSHAEPVIPLSGAEDMYLSAIAPMEDRRSLFSPIAVFTDSSRLRKMAQEALRRLPARDVRCGAVGEATLRPGETGFVLSENGEELTVFTLEKPVSREQKTLLVLSLCQKKYGKIYDLAGVPRAAESIAALSLPDDSEGCAFQRLVMRDALASMLLICGALKEGPLETLLSHLPETHIVVRDIACKNGDKGRILRALCDQITLPHTMSEGIRVHHQDGFATVVPDDHLGSIRITGEARNSEFAQELCDFYQTKIKNITNEKQSASLP